MKKSYPFWMILTLGLFVLAIVFAGAKVTTYASLPAFLVVVFPPFVLVVAVHGLAGIGRSFRVAFEGVAATRQELETGASLFGSLQRYLLLTGLITTMIGLIAMLANLYEADGIGPVVALALITLFYSLMFILTVAVPFRSALEKRLIEEAND